MRTEQSTQAVHRMRGTHQFTDIEREKDDFYFTDPKALELLLPLVDISYRVWEPACGQGHLSKVLLAAGHDVRSTDLIDRGFGETGIDFLSQSQPWDGDILTNPPFKLTTQFIVHALDIVSPGHRVFMFLPITYIEGQSRWYNIYRITPPPYHLRCRFKAFVRWVRERYYGICLVGVDQGMVG